MIVLEIVLPVATKFKVPPKLPLALSEISKPADAVAEIPLLSPFPETVKFAIYGLEDAKPEQELIVPDIGLTVIMG